MYIDTVSGCVLYNVQIEATPKAVASDAELGHVRAHNFLSGGLALQVI
jgi:hypothetical protein